MSNLTAATRSAVTALKAADRADRRLDLKRADALVTLKGEGYSLAATVTLLAAEGVTLSKTRISLLVKAREAAPADVAADEFVTVYVKAETDRNRAASKDKREAKGDTVTGEGGTVPQGNETTVGEVRAATVTDAVRLLWQMVESFGEDATFQHALADALAFTADAIAA